MAEYHLQSPFTRADIRQLRAGDIVYFDGLLFGIRDLTQIYMFDQNHEPPVSLAGAPCIHTAPSLRKVGDKWEKICVGTTTSTRMDRFTPPLIEKYGVRAIIGKGGLYQDSLDAMQKFGAVYLAIAGGSAALETKDRGSRSGLLGAPSSRGAVPVPGEKLRPAYRGHGQPRPSPLRRS